ncbi:MAG: hypothetical protein AB9873_01050 [Syntrophobacteraceae bacterium]
MRFLVVIETPGIQSYLFASPWMREVRGAGAVLNLLNRREIKSLPRELGITAFERVFQGGDAGRFLFDREEDARIFMSAVLDRYRGKAVNAHVALQLLERKPGQPFQEWVSEGVRLARGDLAGRSPREPGLTAPGARLCSSCGSESVRLTEGHPGDPGYCSACLQKRQAADKLYSRVKPGGKYYRPSESAHNLARQYSNKFILTNLAQYSEAEGYSVFLPTIHETIARASRPVGYVGLIHANANRVGEVVRSLESLCANDEEVKRAYRACCEIMDKAIRDAAVEAVLEQVEIKTVDEWDRFVPAEFILAVGEDLLLAVPVQNALDVAIHFMRAFQKKTVDLQQHYMDKNDLRGFFAPMGMTASVGVVLTHVHRPYGELWSPVSRLMKQAKARSAALSRKLKQGESGGEETGTLDFMVLRDGGGELLGEERERKLDRDMLSDTPVHLTGRPYTCSEAESFLQTVRALKARGITHSRLRGLLSKAYRELARTPFGIEGGLIGIENRARGRALEELLARAPHPLFRGKPDGAWSTCFTELDEVYDYIRP